MTNKPQGITMRTAVLVAIARWAGKDDRPHLNVVAFRHDECIACDGHRMVRFPCKTYGYTFGVHHAHLTAAAAAAQSAGGYGSHEVVLVPEASAKPPTIAVWLDPRGSFRLTVPFRDLDEYPSQKTIDELMATVTTQPASSFAVHVFNPSYLSQLADLHAATIDGWEGTPETDAKGRDYRTALQIVAWGSDHRGAVVFKNARGVRFLVMPVAP